MKPNKHFTNFTPKQPAILGRFLLEYLYNSGEIYTYKNWVGTTYILDQNGKVHGTDQIAQTPTLYYLAAQLHYVKTNRCWNVSPVPHVAEWEALLNKRGYTSRDNFIQTIPDYADYRTGDRVKANEYEHIPTQFPTKRGTGVHISTKDRKLLAYYPDNRHILEDRAIKIRPGKYLKKYFPNLTDDEVRAHASRITGDAHLTFHDTFDEMYTAYREMETTDTVTSCMSGDDWGDNLDQHPLQVYHESDVELAVLRNALEEPIGRALYNKHNKHYAMVYGYWEQMHYMLEKSGFIHADLDGARISLIYRNNNVNELVMPYIDGHRELNRSMNRATSIDIFTDTQHCTINKDGATVCNETQGYVKIAETTTCDICGSATEEEAFTYIEGHGYICYDCLLNCFTLIETHNHDDDFYVHNNNLNGFIHSTETDRWFYNKETANFYGFYQCAHDKNWYDGGDMAYIEGVGLIHENYEKQYLAEETDEPDSTENLSS